MVLEYITSGIGLGFTIGVASVIMFRLFMDRMWPVRAPIAGQRGDSVVWDLDERAQVKKSKEGYSVLKLKKGKTNIKPPKYEHVSIDKRGKPVYPIYNTAAGQFFPIKLMNKPRLEVVEDASSKNWAVLEGTRVRSTYTSKESALARYLPFIMNTTFAILIIFMIIYLFGKFEAMSASLASASTGLAQAVERIAPIASGGGSAAPSPFAPVVT